MNDNLSPYEPWQETVGHVEPTNRPGFQPVPDAGDDIQWACFFLTILGSVIMIALWWFVPEVPK